LLAKTFGTGGCSSCGRSTATDCHNWERGKEKYSNQLLTPETDGLLDSMHVDSNSINGSCEYEEIACYVSKNEPFFAVLRTRSQTSGTGFRDPDTSKIPYSGPKASCPLPSQHTFSSMLLKGDSTVLREITREDSLAAAWRGCSCQLEFIVSRRTYARMRRREIDWTCSLVSGGIEISLGEALRMSSSALSHWNASDCR
jgi:hypothetical protein